jgi:dephospho-CoA kinase
MAQKQQRIIIGLVGEKLAGKDTVANYLVEKHGAFHVRFTHILDEILNSLNLPISRQNEIDLGLGLRKIFDERVLGTAVIKRIQSSQINMVVVNGIRMDEMEEIKKLGATIVYVTASPKIRYDRYMQRHEKTDDGVLPYEQFMEQDKTPTEVGIPALGAKADFKIENEGSLEELYRKVDDIINKFK